jgi:hypothetical protein
MTFDIESAARRVCAHEQGRPCICTGLRAAIRAGFDAGRAEGLKRAEEIARGQLAWLPVYPVNVIADAIASERTKREGE